MTDTYDELPYSNNAFALTYPVRLATVAMLHGLTPVDPRQCRVLELGCGRGGNLLPMAETLPESEFVGIDLSKRHIDEAMADTESLGFANIRFEAANILELGSELGSFDYIIAHGVYSWVPEIVQQRIFSLCQSLLTPQGVAYISYNTLPGWHYRGVVRDMLRYHVTREAPAGVQLDQARHILEFVSKVIPDREGLRSRLLREECDFMLTESDSYLFHEHLEANNRACYFHEFAAQLAGYGLQYIGESQVDPLRTCLPPGADDAVRKVCPDDRIRYEQHMDFLTHRTFRRSLLCRSDLAVDETIRPERVGGCWFSSDAAPLDKTVELPVQAVVTFRTVKNVEFTTEHPLVQTALHELYRAAPQSLHFDQLVEAVAARTGRRADDQQFQSELQEMLLACYERAMVELDVVPPQFLPGISAFPQTSRCAQLQAQGDSSVTNRAHQSINLDPLGRFLVRHLDGMRTPADLEDLLVDQVRSGRMTMESESGTPFTQAEVAERCRHLVTGCLNTLVSHRFLIG